MTKKECSSLRGIAIIFIMLHNYCHWLPFAVPENEFSFSVEKYIQFCNEINLETLWGESDNAVRIQIHVTIITYCLIGIIEHDLNLRRPIMQVMRVLGSSLLTKDDILGLFTPSEDEEKPEDGQLEIEFLFN